MYYNVFNILQGDQVTYSSIASNIRSHISADIKVQQML